jgi:STE24 endopeptidase
MRAVLIHELGHHTTQATRFSLVTVWLAAPWRVGSRFVLGLVFWVAARQPRVIAFGMAVLVVALTIVRAARDGQWQIVAILAGLVIAGVGVPLVDAAISRASEWAADRFAVRVGAGYALACALDSMNTPAVRVGWAGRLLARHPPVGRRIAALLAAC